MITYQTDCAWNMKQHFVFKTPNKLGAIDEIEAGAIWFFQNVVDNNSLVEYAITGIVWLALYVLKIKHLIKMDAKKK